MFCLLQLCNDILFTKVFTSKKVESVPDQKRVREYFNDLFVLVQVTHGNGEWAKRIWNNKFLKVHPMCTQSKIACPELLATYKMTRDRLSAQATHTLFGQVNFPGFKVGISNCTLYISISLVRRWPGTLSTFYK